METISRQASGHIPAGQSSYLKKLGDSMNFVADIPREEQDKLLKRLNSITIKKNEYFLRAGDVPQRIGFNVSGLMRLFYIDSNGTEFIKHFCMENTLAISFSAFLLREESKFSIQAIEDTKLLTINYKTYREILDSHVCWQIVSRKLAELLYIIKEKREYELLMNSAQERYLQFLEDYPNLEERLNNYHIASYLGITPESLSRIRTNLRKNKINIHQ
ncbi:MAG: cAMP-binding protein [Deltaproteobacteria bacterium]|nr:cAMP-binding protein [Deltaproteobacteria bacterium]